MKKYLIGLLAVLFLFTSNAFAFEDNQAMMRGVRPMSMGGAFTAVADDENAFFYNPAGITQRQSMLLQIFNIDVTVNTATFDFVKFYSDNKDDLENFDSLPAERQAELLSEINDLVIGTTPNIIASLPNFAFISRPLSLFNNTLSFGAGLFTSVNAKFNFNHSVLIPSLSYAAEATALAAAPVSYRIESLEALRIPGKLSVGATFKYIYRGKASETDMSVAEFEDFSLPFQSGDGYGLDLGFIYHLNSRWNFGMQLSDAFYTNIKYDEYKDDNPSKSKPAYTAGIRPEWNLGVAYFPDKIYYWPGMYFETNKRFTFAADLADIANSDETLTDSFWKKVHLGAEYKFAPFAVRAGVNSGYPTFGAAVATNVVQFEYAFYGEEQGRYAGQDPSWFHRIMFSVKIGENRGRPYGKTVKKKDGEDKKERDKKTVSQDEQKNSGESEKELSDDVKPAEIPKDAKDTISKSSDITEVK